MKALLFFTALLFFLVGATYMFNEPEARGQQPTSVPTKAPDIENKFDSTLDRVQQKVDNAERSQPERVRTKIVYRDRVVHVYHPIESAVIRYDSAVYNVPATSYRGTAVIDGCLLQREMAGDTNEVLTNVPGYIDTLIQEADDRISAWQQVKNFISKPFKRKQ